MRAQSPHLPRSVRDLSGICCAAAALLVIALAASAAHAQGHGHAHKGERAKRCNEPVLACASTATPAFAGDGALWLAYAAAGRIMVARSGDLGRTFAASVPVNGEPQQLDWGPDSRPKIVVEANGRITVAYAIFKDKAFNGQVFVAQSDDAGKTFGAPRAITADPESQRFEAIALDPDGRLFAAWLDKRNRPAARARGEKYAGAALAFAWLSGASAAGEVRLAKDNTCECCRIGVAFAGAGRPVVLFRNIFDGGVRDHAVIAFADAATPGPVQRVSDDGWKTDACPHHGPSLAVSPEGAYHVAWFTNGARRQGLFYAHSFDSGRSFSAPLQIGTLERQAARPTLLAGRDATHLVWKEFDGSRTVLRAMLSTDAGRTWSSPRELAATDGDSDHPLLIADRGRAFVSWLTRIEGYRLLPLGGQS